MRRETITEQLINICDSNNQIQQHFLKKINFSIIARSSKHDRKFRKSKKIYFRVSDLNDDRLIEKKSTALSIRKSPQHSHHCSFTDSLKITCPSLDRVLSGLITLGYTRLNALSWPNTW